MTEQAFEKFWNEPDHQTGNSWADIYGQTEMALMVWQASRQQALEEAAALFSQPYMEYFGDTVVDAIRSLTTTGDKA